MSAGEAALSTAGGSALIVVALIDVFATLFSRGGRRTLSHGLVRGTWVVLRGLSSRPRVLSLAGPLAFLGVITAWAAALAVGWALVYWPQMPDGFLHAAGLSDGDSTSFLDSLYVSMVTLATLGYGDIAPAEGWLRVVAPLEALLGLGLFTAAVSWLLSIFPVLSRRRAFAYEICLLHGHPVGGRSPRASVASLRRRICPTHLETRRSRARPCHLPGHLLLPRGRRSLRAASERRTPP